MTDDQIEKLIWKEIRKRNIILYDMIGMPDHGVDPNPDDHITPRSEKGIRSNRFQSTMGYNRMQELLCMGDYNQWDDYPPLKISIQDLFRFWWNRCADRGLVVEDVLDEIYAYFTALMLPPKEEVPPQMDMTIDFEQIPLSLAQEELPIQMAVRERSRKSA